MLDFAFNQYLNVGGILAAGVIALILLGNLYQLLMLIVDDFESPVKNPVYWSLRKISGIREPFLNIPPTFYRTDAQLTAIEDIYGNAYAKDITKEQQEAISAKYPGLFPYSSGELTGFWLTLMWSIIAFLIPLSVYLLATFPTIYVSILTVVAITLVARTGRRTFKKLTKHISDPKAHTKD